MIIPRLSLRRDQQKSETPFVKWRLSGQGELVWGNEVQIAWS
jgi:hypothetical protein